MDPLIISVALGAVAAGFVQGLSGFAFGLVSLSIWAWTLDPKLAATLAVFGALTGQIIAAISVRRGFNMRVLMPYLAGGLIGIPIGVAVLPLLDVDIFKAVLGTILLVWCPIMLFARHLPAVPSGGRVADGAIGLCGGIMAGIGGFAGTVPTLWCTLRRIDRDTQRSIIQNFNFAVLSVTMLTYVATGMVTTAMLPMFAVVAPAMLIPTLLGARLYIGISEAVFRRIVLSLLTASGITLLASAVPRLLARA